MPRATAVSKLENLEELLEQLGGIAPRRVAFIPGDSRRKNPTPAARVGRLR